MMVYCLPWTEMEVTSLPTFMPTPNLWIEGQDKRERYAEVMREIISKASNMPMVDEGVSHKSRVNFK